MIRVFASFMLLSAGYRVVAAAPALMPLPVKLEIASGSLTIDGAFTASAAGCSDPRLPGAVDRLVARLSRQTGIAIGFGMAPAAKPTLEIACAKPGSPLPKLEDDESYQLNVSADGAKITAATAAGALHGMATFAQLVAPGPSGFLVPAVHIEDKPRFPWRGIMMDSSRHWMPLELVERNLDAMAAVKLNVFHWHLSDDQGFRVESKKYPLLQQKGSDGLFYTQDQIKAVVEYARERGIRVVPEFDIPGHTQAWLAGYPELGAVPGTYEVGRTWGIYNPVIDPTIDYVYQFLDNFLSEMAALFPDPYFHIGGDEVNGVEWKASTRIQEFAAAHKLEGPHGLQVYFNQKIQKILEKNGKIMVGWDEILHPDLPTNIVIQSWRGQKSLADAAQQGRRGILSAGYYLDHLETARQHYAVDPLSGPTAQLTPEQAANVLGGEACMWAEYVSSETVDSRIWPRAAAISERLWSPKEVTDVDSMYARMEAVSRNLEFTGVQHRANYGPMLDRMAGGRPAEPLRVLADAYEATGLGPRARARKYTSLVPLNRFVDAARPESESVRAMEQEAQRATPADLAQLREKFAVWAANDARFQAMADDNALLAELKPLSKDLASAGAMGLKILDSLEGKQTATPEWIADQSKALAALMTPPGGRNSTRPNLEVVFAAGRPVKLLLDRLSKK